jgi:hypothetical protein
MSLSITQQIQANLAQFANKEIKSVPYSRTRERLIHEGLIAIALRCDVTLSAPGIDANGEYRLQALTTPPQGQVCGPFGDFAAMLNKHNPRCGLQPGAHLEASSGWCYINHFDAERLVLEFDEAA